MSVHYRGGDLRRPYLQCDADRCRNKLDARDMMFATDYRPAFGTGWRTVGEGADRRDYCAEHPDAGD